MHFRIQGGSQPHLDIKLMRRLCEALLLNAGHTEGHLLRKRSTHAADMAFFLFGDFLEEGKFSVCTIIDHFFPFSVLVYQSMRNVALIDNYFIQLPSFVLW